MSTELVKYSDVLVDQLVDLGYTHCFFLGGGNVMHLIESARTRMECVAVVHEVSAAIAAEYFNVAMRSEGKRAVVFVTAGPGFTNLVTGLAGAWLESRELLIIGGQARTEFLSRGTVRQIGHQEIDGAAIARPISKASVTVEQPLQFDELRKLSELSRTGRKGPVFIELCLDVTATFVEPHSLGTAAGSAVLPSASPVHADMSAAQDIWAGAQRPMLLIGQGLEYDTFRKEIPRLERLGIPIATSWNAADYLDYDHDLYAGRPNQYGMRWSNAVIQQCDALFVVGARLGLQQTGFNWQEFAPLATKVHVDIDPEELQKANPGVDVKIEGDANVVFADLLDAFEAVTHQVDAGWLPFVHEVKHTLTTNEPANHMFEGNVNPFELVTELSAFLAERDSCLIPCSSGGSYTTIMQGFQQRAGQLLTNDKALASMGYGLAGAIGTSVAHPDKTTVLVEGDGGFAQNATEVGTVANRNLNLKMIVFSNGGYASIRLSQKAYFDGNYIGCDAETGIGLPNWPDFFAAYNIPSVELNGPLGESDAARALLAAPGPGAIIANVHKEQPFYPKLTSRIFPDGSMKSNPLHILYPPLEPAVADQVFRYLPVELRGNE